MSLTRHSTQSIPFINAQLLTHFPLLSRPDCLPQARQRRKTTRKRAGPFWTPALTSLCLSTSIDAVQDSWHLARVKGIESLPPFAQNSCITRQTPFPTSTLVWRSDNERFCSNASVWGLAKTQTSVNRCYMIWGRTERGRRFPFAWFSPSVLTTENGVTVWVTQLNWLSTLIYPEVEFSACVINKSVHILEEHQTEKTCTYADIMQ